MLGDLRVGAVVARLRSEVVKAADEVDRVQERSEYERGYAKGFLKGLQWGLDLVRDFLGR